MLGYQGYVIGYILQHIGLATLIAKLCSKKSKEWVSTDSIACMLIATFARFILFWILYPSTWGTFHLEALVGLLLCGFALYLTYKRNEYKDVSLVSIPIAFKYPVLTAASFIMSLIFPPNVGSSYWYCVLTGFFIYLESISLIPQIYLIKKQGDIGGFTSLYICLVGFSRIFRLLFWISLFFFGIRFYALVLADALHTFLVGELMYEYIKSLRTGTLLPFREKQRHIS